MLGERDSSWRGVSQKKSGQCSFPEKKGDIFSLISWAFACNSLNSRCFWQKHALGISTCHGRELQCNRQCRRFQKHSSAKHHSMTGIVRGDSHRHVAFYQMVQQPTLDRYPHFIHGPGLLLTRVLEPLQCTGPSVRLWPRLNWIEILFSRICSAVWVKIYTTFFIILKESPITIFMT